MTVQEASGLFCAIKAGDNAALNRLLGLMYEDLRELAHSRLKRSQRITVLDTTALVHESYMRLLSNAHLDVSDRRHFLAYAASTMRSIVVDLVRQRHSSRRGGNALHVTLGTDIADSGRASAEEIIRVNDALDRLAEADARLVRIVEMRYFAGLSEREIASSLEVTDRTVRREWRRARLILMAALES
jgi:RNA polymerase sigma factor (TIGR02999 family)